jgi:hypothetical protein
VPFKFVEKSLYFKERRRFKRHHTQSIHSVQIKFLGSEEVSEEMTSGKLRNNSDGGVCIFLDSLLKPKQVVLMSLPLMNEKTMVPTLGEVKWSKRDPKKKKGYDIGISYLL